MRLVEGTFLKVGSIQVRVKPLDCSEIAYLKGMAFRMGQDLGIQRDPKHWTGLSRVSSPTIDLEFRRRVYWGCFVSDK